MAVKSLHRFFYHHSKYLNSMKCREICNSPTRVIQRSRSRDGYHPSGTRGERRERRGGCPLPGVCEGSGAPKNFVSREKRRERDGEVGKEAKGKGRQACLPDTHRHIQRQREREEYGR